MANFSGTVLFIAGGLTLGSPEQEVYDRFVAHGWTASLRAHDDPWIDTDANLETFDLVYVLESVSSSTYNGAGDTATMGLMNTEPGATDELRMEPGSADAHDGTTLSSATSHEASGGIAGGTLNSGIGIDFATAIREWRGIDSSNMAAGGIRLFDRPGAGAAAKCVIVVFPTGSNATSGTFPGRRVWNGGRRIDSPAEDTSFLTNDAFDALEMELALWAGGFDLTTSLQVGVPTSTPTPGNYTPTGAATVHETLDEGVTPDNSTTIITSPTNPVSETFEVQFGALTDPGNNVYHHIGVGLRKTNDRDLTITGVLKDTDGTTRSTFVHTHDSSPTAWTGYLHKLTPAEADAITDYSGLSYEVTINDASGSGGNTDAIVTAVRILVDGAPSSGPLKSLDQTFGATAALQADLFVGGLEQLAQTIQTTAGLEADLAVTHTLTQTFGGTASLEAAITRKATLSQVYGATADTIADIDRTAVLDGTFGVTAMLNPVDLTVGDNVNLTQTYNVLAALQAEVTRKATLQAIMAGTAQLTAGLTVGTLELFCDGFTRADAPDLGPDWNQYTSGVGNLNVSGGEARKSAEDDFEIATVAAAAGGGVIGDSEIVMKFFYDAQIDRKWAGYVRGNGVAVGSGSDGYVLGVANRDSNGWQPDRAIIGRQQDAGSVAVLAQSGVLTFVDQTYYWIRARATGSLLQLKVWEDGTSEPAVWTIAATDGSLASGEWGIWTHSTGNRRTFFDDFCLLALSPAVTLDQTFGGTAELQADLSAVGVHQLSQVFSATAALHGDLDVGTFRYLTQVFGATSDLGGTMRRDTQATQTFGADARLSGVLDVVKQLTQTYGATAELVADFTTKKDVALSQTFAATASLNQLLNAKVSVEATFAATTRLALPLLVNTATSPGDGRVDSEQPGYRVDGSGTV